jgi:hypothetical protein
LLGSLPDRLSWIPAKASDTPWQPHGSLKTMQCKKRAERWRSGTDVRFYLLCRGFDAAMLGTGHTPVWPHRRQRIFCRRFCWLQGGSHSRYPSSQELPGTVGCSPYASGCLQTAECHSRAARRRAVRGNDSQRPLRYVWVHPQRICRATGPMPQSGASH